jgi:hypothetical protein
MNEKVQGAVKSEEVTEPDQSIVVYWSLILLTFTLAVGSIFIQKNGFFAPVTTHIHRLYNESIAAYAFEVRNVQQEKQGHINCSVSLQQGASSNNRSSGGSITVQPNYAAWDDIWRNSISQQLVAIQEARHSSLLPPTTAGRSKNSSKNRNASGCAS